MTKIREIVEVRKNQYVVKFFCDYCGELSSERKSHYDRKLRHYCNRRCYSFDRMENWGKEDQPTWRGGVTPSESHRRWKKKNPEKMAHLKARRYARERGAKGSHTLEEWESLCDKYDNKCAACGSGEKLTKDHVIPLSKGGSDYIQNIQPLCRSCNSKKWNHIYENPELLEE